MENSDRKIAEAIEFFETMLESMPGDRTSLEFLVVAYEQTGLEDKRRKCMIDLADVLLNEKDYEKADSIARQLLNNFSADSDAMQAVKRVNQAVVANQDKSSPLEKPSDAGGGALEAEGDGSFNVPDSGIEVHANSRAALSSEMDLVWMLKDREVLPIEINEELIRALSEFPVSERPQLISALSFLDDQHPEWTDAVMSELQKMSNMPAIPLELFGGEEIIPSGLSAAYMIIRGVIPFASLDDEFLIAVLNPLDEVLRKDVCKRLGTNCHFFLSHPRISMDVLSKCFEL